MGHKDFKYNENTIDSILGTPSKIVIPERYIPEQVSYLISVIISVSPSCPSFLSLQIQKFWMLFLPNAKLSSDSKQHPVPGGIVE